MDPKRILADLQAGKISDVTAALVAGISSLPAEAAGGAADGTPPPAPRSSTTIIVDLFESIIGLLGNHDVLGSLLSELKSVI